MNSPTYQASHSFANAVTESATIVTATPVNAGITLFRRPKRSSNEPLRKFNGTDNAAAPAAW